MIYGPLVRTTIDMAGAKRRSISAHSSPSTRTLQRTRPSVEDVEVSSDVIAQDHATGPGRGLDDSNIIFPVAAQHSVEQANGDKNRKGSTVDKVNRHMTRGARHGRTDKSINYDMKCKFRSRTFVGSSVVC